MCAVPAVSDAPWTQASSSICTPKISAPLARAGESPQTQAQHGAWRGPILTLLPCEGQPLSKCLPVRAQVRGQPALLQTAPESGDTPESASQSPGRSWEASSLQVPRLPLLLEGVMAPLGSSSPVGQGEGRPCSSSWAQLGPRCQDHQPGGELPEGAPLFCSKPLILYSGEWRPSRVARGTPGPLIRDRQATLNPPGQEGLCRALRLLSSSRPALPRASAAPPANGKAAAWRKLDSFLTFTEGHLLAGRPERRWGLMGSICGRVPAMGRGPAGAGGGRGERGGCRGRSGGRRTQGAWKGRGGCRGSRRHGGGAGDAGGAQRGAPGTQEAFRGARGG